MPKFRKKPVIVEATQWFKIGDLPTDECTDCGFEGARVACSLKRFNDISVCSKCK